MPYFIQRKDKLWDNKSWRTWDDEPFETVEAAREAAEKTCLNKKPGVEYRIVESYTVTRYKPVKM